MIEHIKRPSQLQINAWTGDDAPREGLPSRTPWAQEERFLGSTQWLAPAAPVDDRRWDHPDVGWGLILRDNADLKPAELARADDAPAALQRLLKARPGSPVLRYRPELQQGYLRRYYADRKAQDLSVQAPRPGLGDGRIPQYLLISGSPREIPWALQYALNMSAYVGRIDLTGPALDNYVDALISDWKEETCNPRAPVVWSVDHGSSDITWLMARAVAGKVWEEFENDADLTGRLRLNEHAATRAALGAALAERSPALIITSSHGMTGPLNDTAQMAAQLGVPVDAQHQPLSLEHLKEWRPSGAIWYAHACCSAGSDAESRYKGLLAQDGEVGGLLNKVAAAAGATVAPLAQALLGAERPLRAFVGHVEPTFDWTLRDPANGQVLTHVLQKCLYKNLYQQDRRTPIGHALQSVYNEAGAFYGSWQDTLKRINNNESGMRDWALYRQLVAMDRQTLVILGDPTVSLPPLSGVVARTARRLLGPRS